MKEIILLKSDESYLEHCATEMERDGLSHGIIIGQKIDSEKYVVVHLARNREEDYDVRISKDQSLSSIIEVQLSQALKTLLEVEAQSVANQWLSATKMMPGCFSVLGFFGAAHGRNIVDDNAFTVANNLLKDIRSLLMKSHWFDMTFHDLVFLAYSSLTREASSKLYKFSADDCIVESINCVFLEEPFDWYTFNCTYELDEVFPMAATMHKIDIQLEFKKAIEAVQEILEESEILIHHESADDGLRIGDYVKSHNPVVTSPNEMTFNVNVILPIKCQSNDEAHAVKVRQFGGTIRLIGGISSRVYCNPQNTIADMKRFVRTDIVRSLATRVQVYCEGLTNTKISHEAIMISEPPRRVYFNIVGRGKICPIQFSEYLFRNDITAMAATQAKQVLDLNLNKESITDDLETLPEEETFSNFSSDIIAQDSPSLIEASRELNRTMYLLGITISLLVLLLSACLHFFFKV